MITATYLLHWYPSLPRSQWSKPFDQSKVAISKEHTWTMATLDELNIYAKYYSEKHGCHSYEKIREINRNRNENN